MSSPYTHTHTPTCHMSTRKLRPQPLRSRPPTWRIEYHFSLSLHHTTPYFIQKSLLQPHCLSWNLSSTRIWQYRLLVWYPNRPLYPKPGVARGESDLLTPAIIPWITGTEPPDSLNCCFLFCRHLLHVAHICIRSNKRSVLGCNGPLSSQFLKTKSAYLEQNISSVLFIHWEHNNNQGLGDMMESVEKECGALGGLFQAIVNDMKVPRLFYWCRYLAKKDGCVLLPLFSSGVQLPAPLMLWLMEVSAWRALLWNENWTLL